MGDSKRTDDKTNERQNERVAATGVEEGEGIDYGNTESIPDTKQGRRKDSSYWCFTHFLKIGGSGVALIFNPKLGKALGKYPMEIQQAEWETKRIFDILCKLPHIKWIVMQLEATKSGKVHIQGAIGFGRTERMFPGLKKIMPGCHVAVSRNWKNSQSYCSKTESRITGPWLFGVKQEDILPWGIIPKDETKEQPGRKQPAPTFTKEQWAEYEKLFDNALGKAMGSNQSAIMAEYQRQDDYQKNMVTAIIREAERQKLCEEYGLDPKEVGDFNNYAGFSA